MSEFFSNLEGVETFYFYVALAGTTFFVLQSLFTFLGFGDQFDMDADYDGEVDFDGSFIPGLNMTLHIVSLRGIVAFLMIFGWSGLSFVKNGMNEWLALGLAFLAGFTMMVIISLIYYAATKMGQSGNVNMNDAIGKECEVYYPIPGDRAGIGKVHIVLGGGLKELEALTTGETLKSGELVVVTSLIENKLVVEKIS